MTKEGVARPLKFQGTVPYPPEQKTDDWGLNAEQQASCGMIENGGVELLVAQWRPLCPCMSHSIWLWHLHLLQGRGACHT